MAVVIHLAALYLRRSTEEHQAASLETQREEAERYCIARGWKVVETYVDSGVSRAEFVERHGLARALVDANAGKFHALVMRDETRLGGDIYRTGTIIGDLVDAGVELHYYAGGGRVEFNDPTSRLMAALRGYAAEIERLKTSERTRERHAQMARRGHVTGGRVYGYDNVPVMEGERRERVEHRINPDEAAVVREIFDRYGRGEGLRTIAHDLNVRGVPAPRAGNRGTGSWAQSSLHAIVHRERYRGVIEWGRVGSAYKKGTRVAVERPDEQVIRVERPELAIIDAETWERAQRKVDVLERLTSSRAAGRPPAYLLSGLARCAECGGPLQVSNHRHGTAIIKAYLCGYARDRGKAVCTSTLRRPVAELDAVVCEWIQREVLTDAVITRVLEGVRAEIARRSAAASTAPTEVGALRKELERVTREVTRLTAAIAATDASPDALVAALKEREVRARDLRGRIAVAESAPSATVLALDVDARARVVLAELRERFARNTTSAREVLGALLTGPIQARAVLWEGRRRFHLEGEVRLPLQAYSSHTDGDPNGYGAVRLSRIANAA